MLFLLDFDFLVLLVAEVTLAVFSAVAGPTLGVLLISGFSSTMLLLVSTLGNGACSLITLVSSSLLLLAAFNVTTMAGVLLTTFRLNIIQVKICQDECMFALTHQDLPCLVPKCLQFYESSWLTTLLNTITTQLT